MTRDFFISFLILVSCVLVLSIVRAKESGSKVDRGIAAGTAVAIPLICAMQWRARRRNPLL